MTAPRPHPSILRKLKQLWRVVRESHRQPLTGQPIPATLVAPEDLGITFIGHSSFLIQIANRHILIDPVFATRLILLRRQRRPGLRIQDLPPIDAVLLTHAHMDHLNISSLRRIVRHTRRITGVAPRAIVPKGVADLVDKLGFRAVTELEWWDTTTILAATPSEDITVTMTPCKHWGARMFSDTHRHYGGYVIETGKYTAGDPYIETGKYTAGEDASETERFSAGDDASEGSSPNERWSLSKSRNLSKRTNPSDGKSHSEGEDASEGSSLNEVTNRGEGRRQSIYHSGDTAYFPGFRDIGTMLHPRIALLPIGAYSPDSYRAVHTSPEEALQAFLDLGTATTMIPMHFGTFPLGREPMAEPPTRLLAAAKKAGIASQIKILAEGEMYTETQNNQSTSADSTQRRSA